MRPIVEPNAVRMQRVREDEPAWFQGIGMLICFVSIVLFFAIFG